MDGFRGLMKEMNLLTIMERQFTMTKYRDAVLDEDGNDVSDGTNILADEKKRIG